MRVLAFDTAGPVVGVALGDDVRQERVTRGAEARLIPWALELCGGDLSQVDAIAVAIGPGAFTGVRVGLATAQGLAFALGVPCFGTHSIQTRGHRARADLALLDARKSRFYAGWSAEGYAPADLSLDDVFDHGRAQGFLKRGFLCTGEGALVAEEAILAAGGRIAPEADSPAVDELSRWAAERLAAGDPPGTLLPLYLREPDAVPPRRGV